MGDPADEVIVEVEKKKETVTNGEAPDANGNTEEAKAGAPDANGNTEEAVETPRIMKTVDGIVAKLKNDTNLSARYDCSSFIKVNLNVVAPLITDPPLSSSTTSLVKRNFTYALNQGSICKL